MQDDQNADADEWNAASENPITPARILIVDDEMVDGDNCAFTLSKVGKHDVRVMLSPVEAREMAREWRPEIILLDIEMPEMDGYTLARLLKQDNTDADLVFVTNRRNISDKMRGLNLTEHYLTKPFHPLLLLGRVNAILRRRRSSHPLEAATTASSGPLILDHTALSVTNPPLPPKRLTPIMWEVLTKLVDAQGKAVTNDTLLQEVWGDTVGGEGRVHVNISRLRKCIEHDPANPEIILTKDHGYAYNINLRRD